MIEDIKEYRSGFNMSKIIFQEKLQQSNEDPLNDHEAVVQEAKPKLKKPALYRVVLINDDYTPMEFVIDVLMMFFSMNQEQSTQVMLAVHTQGKGVCGTYSKDVAETKAAQVNQFARDNKHPLLCEVEVV